MRTIEEQIADLANLFGEEGTFSFVDDLDAATKHILEAERRAEQRVRAEIARDSERLDWLERIAPDISMVGDGWGNRDHWHLVFADISKGVPSEYTGDTIRQAIDAAREVK